MAKREPPGHDFSPSPPFAQQANQAPHSEQGTRFEPALAEVPEANAYLAPREGHVPPPKHGQPAAQTLNNRFVLKEQLGTGGMGTVYRALDLRRVEAEDRNPYVAVKILSLQFQAHPSSFIALQREAKKAQSLAHPNIVTVYDFDRDGATVYMTMEYLTGQSLREQIKAAGSAGMRPQEAFPLIEGMAKALIYAHEKGIVHCDFKPANVLANERGEVKVIDFGIARAFKQAEDDVDLEATRFDPGSLRALTPTYASAEMLEDREPDPRDDIYALGCIAYEMLAGHHPFDGLTSIEARSRGLIPKRVPGLTARQWRALRAALALEREQRTPTVAQFVKPFLASQRRLPWLPLVAVFVIVLSAISLYHFKPRWLLPSPETTAITPSPTGKAEADPLKEDRSLAIPPLGPSNEPAPGADAPPARAIAPGIADVLPPAVSPPEQAVSAASLSRLLERISCSALTAALHGSTVAVAGFSSDQRAMGRLQEQVLSLPGVRQFSHDVHLLNEDKCDVLELYASHWMSNRRERLGASISPARPGSVFTEGERLVIKITTPAYPSYVNIDYFTLNGEVVHLVPSPDISDNQAPASYRATLGDLGEWRIGPPFGRDLIALLITPEALFTLPRPPNEPRSDYLAAVAKRLKEMEANGKPTQIAADLLLITTQSTSQARRSNGAQ